MGTKKHAGGRPTKLTEEFVAAMMDVVNGENNALIYTDEVLVVLLNGNFLSKPEFAGSLWMNGKIADDARAQKFFSIYNRALLKQKSSLCFVKDANEMIHRVVGMVVAIQCVFGIEQAKNEHLVLGPEAQFTSAIIPDMQGNDAIKVTAIQVACKPNEIARYIEPIDKKKQKKS